MSALVDITGQRFNRWTVLTQSLTKNGRATWLCRCECGTEKVVEGSALRRGKSGSCGCLANELIAERLIKHNCQKHPLYNIWLAARQRTINRNSKDYPRYGGRGIKMHPRWENNVESFVKYLLSALGPKPTPQHSLDRIDNDQGYIPGNLRWATKSEQNKNRRPYHQWKFA
jgi:hypothetical protein